MEAITDDAFRHNRFIVDASSGTQCLVDIGADIGNRPRPTKFKLFAANEMEIDTRGAKLLNVDLHLRRQFLWKFIVARIIRAIINVMTFGLCNAIVSMFNGYGIARFRILPLLY